MPVLRGFQRNVKSDNKTEWNNGSPITVVASATGTGKTVMMASHCADHNDYGCAIAHRKELVGQIAMALAVEGVRHSIIAPKETIAYIRNKQLEELGKHYVDPMAKWSVASVDTLINRNPNEPFFKRVTQVHFDEGHHVTRMNKWGAAFSMFSNPNLHGALWTACPDRADGQGLGKCADGVADALVEAPPMRWMIDNGYLTDYEVYCPTPRDLDLSGLTVMESGDFSMTEMQKAMAKSQTVVGDVVDTYCKRAWGKLGITFAVGIAEAEKIAAEFNRRGVPAAVLHGKSPAAERDAALKQFANRKIWQLVNVDLFDEGFDLPAIECVSFARPTASFNKYAQMWGRALRLMISEYLASIWDTLSSAERLHQISISEKPIALIFDHVGNLLRHKGPPDKPRVWKLERRQKRAPADGIPLRICTACEQPYERWLLQCPYCGVGAPAPEGGARSPETVDGDLFLVSPDVLKAMRDEVDRIDGAAFVPKGVPARPVTVNHHERQVAQHHLRATMGWWAAAFPQHSDRENARRFFHTFGIDILSAQALNKADANALREKIVANLATCGIVINDLSLPHD